MKGEGAVAVEPGKRQVGLVGQDEQPPAHPRIIADDADQVARKPAGLADEEQRDQPVGNVLREPDP